MRKLLVGLALLSALGAGCKPAPKKMGVTALAPPVFQTVYSDPSTGAGIAAAVGTIVQLSGGTAAWQKSGVNSTDWVAVPASGGGIVDGGVTAPLSGAGSVANPLTIAAATTSVAGSMSAADKSKVPTDLVVTAVGNVQDLEITGLNGDLDGDYEIDFYINSLSSNAIALQPNQLTTNQKSFQLYSDGSAAHAANPGTTLGVCAADTTVFTGTIYLTSHTGQQRFFKAESWDQTNSIPVWTVGAWNDTSTNITALRLHHPNATGIGNGSFMRLRKLKKV